MIVQMVDSIGLKNKDGTYANFAPGDVVKIGEDTRVWTIEKITHFGWDADSRENEGRIKFRRKATKEDRNKEASLFVYLDLDFAYLVKYGMRHYGFGEELPDADPNIVFARSKHGS